MFVVSYYSSYSYLIQVLFFSSFSIGSSLAAVLTSSLLGLCSAADGAFSHPMFDRELLKLQGHYLRDRGILSHSKTSIG